MGRYSGHETLLAAMHDPVLAVIAGVVTVAEDPANTQPGVESALFT